MVKKLISVFLAAVITVTGLTVSASAAANEYEILWGYDLYDLLGLVRSNSTYFDVTNKNDLNGQRLNKMKASGSNLVFAPYKFTLKKSDTIQVDCEVVKAFYTSGLGVFIFDEDMDDMYYLDKEYLYDPYYIYPYANRNLIFRKTSNFDSTKFSFSIDLPKGKYYMIFVGSSDTKGDFSISFTAKKSLEKKPQVTATALGDGKVKLKWKKVEGATKYRVCKVVAGKFKTIKKSTKKTTYTVTGLTKRNSYKFGVQAYVNGKWTTINLPEAIEIKAE